VTAVGEVDVTEEARFREAVLGPMRRQSVNRVVVDLGRLRFMDAGGAHVLIDAHQEAMRRAKRFQVVNVCGLPKQGPGDPGRVRRPHINVRAADGIENLIRNG
jgi:hypothetical protein